ncbi:Uma2 family endonuclease [Amycolatopsis suaedae]|uniref:Uma2 family endonuclease n=1 Tax=Amycolatopsis suaedae TaxID=2510978 RepID=A0A4V2ELP9_9PSEU|nr:Uma2 family endonuclease [Amycolatopsis suaedae]RZQ62325.1 Uma2 family endonuclease [Amycolatopsis suaedae]
METVPTFAHGERLSRRDLELITDERHRYELVDGTLLVSPSPRPLHQRVVARVLAALTPLCPEDCEVLPAPVDVVLDEHTVLIPDVVVGRRDNFTERALEGTPVLAVEVVSPSSERIDRYLKPARLAAAGCPYYWVIDPRVPSLSCFRLDGDAYRLVAEGTGDDEIRLDAPYSLTLSATSLVSPMP